MPWATLALAFVAILTIIQADMKEKKERRLRRLSSIIDWATDVINKTKLIEFPDIKYLDGGTETYEILRQQDEIKDFNSLVTSGEYLKRSALIIDKTLYVSVHGVIQAINELLAENWKNLDVDTTRELLQSHEQRIYGMANNLLVELDKRLK